MEDKQIGEDVVDELMEELPPDMTHVPGVNVQVNAVEASESEEEYGVTVKALRRFADENGNHFNPGEVTVIGNDLAAKFIAEEVVVHV